MDCTIRIAKTKALISCAVTAQLALLICVFVFAYSKSRFSHNEAHLFMTFKGGYYKTFLVYSQTCLKQPYATRHILGFLDRWLPIAD